MEIIIGYLFLVAWTYLVSYLGREAGRREKEVIINSLSFRQSIKWVWIHELKRHQDDIDSIKKDLNCVKDVILPNEALGLAGNIHFVLKEIPKWTGKGIKNG
jgi:hypothetical protein